MWTISLRGAREALTIAVGMLGLSVAMVTAVLTLCNALDLLLR